MSLAPNVTELIVAAGGQQLLVGTDSFSDYPPPVRDLPKVGDLHPNIELIAQLQPDVVFAVSSAAHPSLAQALANLGIPLHVITADRLEDVPRAIQRIGEILGTSAVAAAAVREFQQQLASERRVRSRKPRLLFAAWIDPLYVAGKATFIDDLIELTGSSNAVRVSGWPQYSLESLAAAPPDLIVVATERRTAQQIGQLFQETSPWKELAAVKSGFWYVVDEDPFVRLGPRAVQAAAELNRVIEQWEQKP